MEQTCRILIIEDDADIAMVEQVYLENSGYETHTEPNADRVMQILKNGSYDLILLDLMLPGKNGYDVCREIRQKYNMPILMVTARRESFDKVKGLNLGADDYITKPFDPAELVARVRTNLRQYKRNVSISEPEAEKEIVIGTVRVLKKARKVFKNGKEIHFPKYEFELLLFLAENPNVVFSREQLITNIWGYDYMSDGNTVMVHINRIRNKIEDDKRNPKIIETVWGAGYRLNQ
ncbi:MAG: response regulator transcription factor [Clostridiales bacterium]|nr:response regulator transcription factor [Clostridiales bacterium]